jgi:hypothetical protein
MKSEEFKRLLYLPKTDKIKLFAQLKASGDAELFEKTIRQCISHPLTRKLIFSNPLPQKYEEIRQSRVVSNTGNIEGEIIWNIYAIKSYFKEINEFILLKKQFENFFLLDNLIEADKILNNIENNISKSLWSLENRFLLKEYKDGTESNWSFLSELSKKTEDPFLLFFIENYSKRAESKIPYFRFRNIFDTQINEINGPVSFKEYICFRLNYIGYFGFVNYPFILTVESISPIIDRYLLLRDVIIDLYSQQEVNSKPFLEKTISKLAENLTHDNTLNNICGLFEPEKVLAKSDTSEIGNIIDNYTKGLYKDCVELIPNALTRNPSSIELYEIYIKSLIESNTDFTKPNISRIIDEVLHDLFNVYSRNGKSDESSEKLLKLSLSFYSFNWARQLFSLLSCQNNINYSNKTYQLLYPVFSEIFNPRLILFLNDQEKFYSDKNNTKIKTVVLHSLINSGQFESIQKDSNLSSQRKPLYIGRAMMKAKKYEEAKSHFEKLYNSKNISITAFEEIINYLFYIYIKLKYYREAIILFVNNYLQNKSIITRFKTNEFLRTIEKNNCSGLENLIDLPIFFKIISDDPYQQYVAYDIFISNYNLHRPQEVFKIRDKFEPNKYIYFLREVCTSDILHHSYYFEGSDDIDNERIFVLRELLKIDKINESIYIKELAEVSQASNIRRAIREVNRGRITVNVQQIKNIESSNIKEGFNRYKDLSNYAKNKELVGIDSTSKLISEYLKNLNEEKQQKSSNQIKDPAFISFKVLFIELRDKYLLSKEYGLDGYLSTRIRHGAFQNHIRSVFESIDLIAKKDKDGNYLDVETWKDRLPYVLYLRVNDIQAAIKRFSKKIDDLTEYIVKELLQVYTEKHLSKPNAIFNYSFTLEYLWVVFSYVKDNIKDYERFLEYVFRELEVFTETRLEIVRNMFHNETKENYFDIITDFHSEIKSIVGDNSFVDLTSSIIKCKTNIQNELENISEWFYLSNPSTDLILDLKTLIRTSVEITNTIYPNYKISPKIITNTDIPIYGSIHFIYIMRILIDNIISHSGLESNKLVIEIKSDFNDNNKMFISVKNNFADYIEIDKLNATLNDIKEKWKTDINSLDKINIEGGSGFDKIRRILLFDLGSKNYEFNYCIEDRNLSIIISLDVKIQEYE